jgi:hypothetical protein
MMNAMIFSRVDRSGGGFHRLVLRSVVAVATLTGVLVPSVAAHAAVRLDSVVLATFDGGTRSGVIAAMVSPTDPVGSDGVTPNRMPVTFTVACADTAPCAAADGGSTVWEFGDGSSEKQTYTANGGNLQMTSTLRSEAGTTRTATSTVADNRVIAASHHYLSAGDFTAHVKLTTPAGIGSADIRVLVADRYVDVDVDSASKPARADRAALRTAAALKWLTACRTALDQADGVAAGSTDDRRAMLCPEPTSTYTQWVGANPTPLTMPAGTTVNGLTGADCMSSPAACGLPADVFARYNGGDPTKSCNTDCQAALVAAGKINGSVVLTHDLLNCGDGWTAARANGVWSIVAGVEPGCMTRGEFMLALVTAIDGPNPSQRRLADSAVCPDGVPGGLVGDAIRRAAALGLTVTHDRGGQKCDANLPLTKADLYISVAQATHATDAAVSTLRDLADVTLGHGNAAAYSNAGKIGALLAAGSTLVGNTACADGGAGVCFNPTDPVTRAQVATLLAGQLIGLPTLATGLQVAFTSSADPAKVGQQVTLKVRVQAPAQTDPATTATVTWPAAVDGVSTRGCGATSTATFGAAGYVVLTCGWTRSTTGTTALAVRVQTSDGLTSTQTIPLTASNTAPVIAAGDMATATEDVDGTSMILAATDKDGGTADLTYKVRSFAPSEPDPGLYAQTGKRATTAWGTTAEVATGKITATPGSGQVTLRWDRTTDALGATVPNTNGGYAFALQVCDSGGACTVRSITGDVTAVNDAPTAPSLTTVTGPKSQTWNAVMAGSDAADSGRPGYPAGPAIVQYRVDSVPASGTLRYDADPGSGTNWLVATPGSTTNNPTVQFTAPGTTSSDSFSFSVADAGYPGSAWSASPRSVLLSWS